MPFSTCSAGALTGPDFCFIFAPGGYDEPEILAPQNPSICLTSPGGEHLSLSFLSMPGQRPGRRLHIALPNRPVIELDSHAVGRVHCAHIECIDPNAVRRIEPVWPCTRRYAGLGQKIEFGSVLRDVGQNSAVASLNALITSGQIDRLGGCTTVHQRADDCDSEQHSSYLTFSWEHSFERLASSDSRLSIPESASDALD